MNKTFSIARTEFVKHLRKPTFWLTLLGVPLLAAVISFFNADASSPEKTAIPGLSDPAQIKADIEAGKPQIGFVDLSGTVAAIPASFPAETANLYRQYPDVEAARAAMVAKEIPAFYVIPADYIAKGELIYYSPQFSPFGNSFQQSLIETLIATSLLDSGDVGYARSVLAPTQGLTIEPLNPAAAGDSAAKNDDRESAAFTLGYAFAMLLYISIFVSASLLLQALIEEKENRVIEVVLSSVSPRTLLRGKILGLGLLGLLQLSVWLAIGFAGISSRSALTSSLAAIKVAPTVWLLALVCFGLGYLIYASLMAGIGAIANTMRESSQLTIVVVLPIILPLVFLSVLINQPNGALSQALTYFPLTSPIVLVIRSAISNVPIWQTALALALMVATIVLLQSLAARMFKATTLLAGDKPSFRGLARALRANG
jgi:ABC-2 type transport system permease protein